MTYYKMENISTQRFSEVDFLSMGPTAHQSCVNANQYIKNNIDHIVPQGANDILVLDLTWASEIDQNLKSNLLAGKAPYDYILLYNLFDGWLSEYSKFYYQIKEHYKLNIIGPQPLEPENFLNFHEYNVASWTSLYKQFFLDRYESKSFKNQTDFWFDWDFFYYAGGYSEERLTFINELYHNNNIRRSNHLVTFGIAGGMNDANEDHYPDNLGNLQPWTNSIVNIVSETRNGTAISDFPGCFVTEKTFKPIFTHTPFIHINQSEKFTKFLTDTCGYKLYNSFFDIPEHQPTNQEVIEALIRVSDMSQREKNIFYKSMLPTIKYNYNNLQQRADRIHNMFSNRSA